MSEVNKELLRKIDDAPLLMKKDAAAKKLRKPRNIYADQTVFMLAIVVLSGFTYGLRPVIVCAVSVFVCAFADMLGCFISKKEYSYKDLSNVCYGLAVALMLPASVNYWIVVLGASLAIAVKHIFGGKDNYIFNPAAVAIAFLIICYPGLVLLYPERTAELPLFDIGDMALSSGLESLFIKTGAMPNLTPLDIIIGNFAGPMGTTHILVIVVCGICLICRRSVSLSATVGGLAVMSLILYISSPADIALDSTVFCLISGFVLFGFVFLASDPQTLPLTNGGRLLYGISLGAITAIFRETAHIEGVFVFSLLIVNALSLYFDRMAFNIVAGIRRAIKYLHTNFGSFERITKDMKQGKTVSLSDTQEIIVEPVNFNMPPIDNKVTKVRRKKKFALRDIIDSIRDASRRKKKKHKENGDE